MLSIVRNAVIFALLACLLLFAACTQPSPTLDVEMPYPSHLLDGNQPSAGSNAMTTAAPTDITADNPVYPTGGPVDPGTTPPYQPQVTTTYPQPNVTTGASNPVATNPPTAPPSVTTTQPRNKQPMPSGTAQILQTYNDLTRKVNTQKAGFRKTNVTKKYDITGLETLPSLIRSVAEPPMLEKVDEFLGVGNFTYTTTKGQNPTAAGALLTSGLTAGDITSASCAESGDNYVLTLNVKGCTNPERNSGNPLGRYTADFRTSAEGITTLQAGMPIKMIVTINVQPKVDSITITANPSSITCTINKYTGQLTGVRHQFSFYVEIINVVSKAVGMEFTVAKATGKGSSDVTYSNFQF